MLWLPDLVATEKEGSKNNMTAGDTDDYVIGSNDQTGCLFSGLTPQLLTCCFY